MGDLVNSVADVFGFGPASKQADAVKDASGKSLESAQISAALQRELFDKQLALQKELYEKQLSLQEPWRLAGVNALNRVSAGVAPGGEFATPFSQTNWQSDPGYQFRLKEGLNALNRSAAARGGLGSGASAKAALRYGQDLGSQEYQNAFNRYYGERDNMLRPLQSLAGLGQTSANVIGDAGNNYGNAVGNAGRNYANSVGEIWNTNAMNQGNAALSLGNIRASQYGSYGRALDQAINTDWSKIGNSLSSWFGGGGGSASVEGGSDIWASYF